MKRLRLGGSYRTAWRSDICRDPKCMGLCFPCSVQGPGQALLVFMYRVLVNIKCQLGKA